MGVNKQDCSHSVALFAALTRLAYGRAWGFYSKCHYWLWAST